MNELVSVIIPAYNSYQTIRRTVESVINQTYKNIEIIIVDDCSTDESYEVIKKLAEIDNKIRCYRNEINLGVAETRNRAIGMSKGQFICFLDSDDVWIENKIEKQIEYIRVRQADICYTGYYMCNEDGSNMVERNVPLESNYISLLKENVICCSTVLIKSELIKKNKFNNKYFHEDFVLWLELLKRDYCAVGLNEYLVIYHKGGRSADKLKACKNRWIVYRKCEKLNIMMSIYYLITYSLNGIRKYYIKNK